MDPLIKEVSGGPGILTTRQLKQLFGNIREIEALSGQIVAALKETIGDISSADNATAFVEASHTKSRVGQLQVDQERPQQTLTRSTSAPALFQPALGRIPKIANVLLSHLPYLSLYYPYIAAFPSVPSTIIVLCTQNSRFRLFLHKKEQDPRCKRLGLSHWLLTVVQRIPRWTILIENLIKVTDDPIEKQGLARAHGMAEKVAENINTRLREQTAMLTLINLQKAFSGLSKPLVAPARRLVKKGESSMSSLPCRKLIGLYARSSQADQSRSFRALVVPLQRHSRLCYRHRRNLGNHWHAIQLDLHGRGFSNCIRLEYGAYDFESTR